MPTWNELLTDLMQQPEESRGPWITGRLTESLSRVGERRDGRNVMFYASAFLQKPAAPGFLTMIMPEDINGFMGATYKLDCSRGLTLMLHTPGGVTTAAESVVAYLRSKFGNDLEVLVPTYAMSAGTMIALASDRIIMGRQSQLGPIDPQLNLPDGRSISVSAVLEQFQQARREIFDDQRAAHVWAPILQSLGPSFLSEAENHIQFSTRMVAEWLDRWMLQDAPTVGDATAGQAVAQYFSDAGQHKDHGRRIGRDEAREHGVSIVDLEDDQTLQEAALTAYHIATLMFEQSPCARMITTSGGHSWIKNHAVGPSPV